MNFHEFTADYIKRLGEGDPFVAEHFRAYFWKLLVVKLGRRGRPTEFIEDVAQETFRRVIALLRSGREIEHPERFGAFVHAIAVNVERELSRPEHRYVPIDGTDFTDARIDLDSELVTAQRKRQVRAVLDELPERDRRVLELRYLHDWPLERICRELGVDASYVRVVLHRARNRFREKMGNNWAAHA
ncbi:MAG TPA: sigma-70 family RNA polymerase sigma factor [Bryobacteraceae bacterium]|nr:sigma-70 family RNA polymerase sigma factor [Bryobacteraceae bacterium]